MSMTNILSTADNLVEVCITTFNSSNYPHCTRVLTPIVANHYVFATVSSLVDWGFHLALYHEKMTLQVKQSDKKYKNVYSFMNFNFS